MKKYRNQYDAICDFTDKLKSTYFTNELDVIGPSTSKKSDTKSDSGDAYVLTSSPNAQSHLGDIYIEGLRKGVYGVNLRLKSSDVATSTAIYKITAKRIVGDNIDDSVVLFEKTLRGTDFSYCGADEYSNIILPMKYVGDFTDVNNTKICISINIESNTGAKTLSFDYCLIQLAGMSLSLPT